MVHATVVAIHVVGAVSALIAGFLALNFPNGTPRHRLVGKIYLVGWLALGVTGVIIGWERPGISPFEVLNWIGMVQVAQAYGVIFFRKRLGRRWLRMHYNGMVSSMAGLVIAAINQVLPRIGIEYPLWVFFIMVALPFFVLPPYIGHLDRRYGFANDKAKRGTIAPQQPQQQV